MTEREHLPDPDFVARLEGQLTTEYRRLERLGDLDRWRLAFGKWLRAAIYILSGLLLGAASVTMAQRAGNAEELGLLQLQASAKVRLAEQEVELNRQVLDDITGQVAAGTMVPTALLSAQAALVGAETRLKLARLDVEEVDASRGPVRNEISAPRIGGRDFFSERLLLRLEVISARIPSLEEVIRLAEVRVQAGTADRESLLPLTMERTRLMGESEQIRGTLVLRQSFLDGDFDAAEAELGHRLLLATTRRQVAETTLAALREKNARLQEGLEVGVVTQDAAVAMQRELLQAEAEVQMVEIEVQLIERELAP